MTTKLGSYSYISLTVALATLLAVAANPRVAEAQTAKEKSKASALLKEGAKLLGNKDYAEALQKFEDAYAVVPSPKILFNVGLANEGLARPARAMRAFNEYLAGATSDTDQRRKEAADHIAYLKSKVALLTIRADVDGAHVTVDGEDSGTTPLSNAIALEPGNHQIVVQAAAGKPWTKAIKAIAGSSMQLDAIVKDAPAPVVTSPVVATSASTVPTTSNSPPDAARDASNGLTQTAAQSKDDEPIYHKGWFWGVAGAVVVVGVVTAIVIGSGTTTEYKCPTGIQCL